MKTNIINNDIVFKMNYFRKVKFDFIFI